MTICAEDSITPRKQTPENVLNSLGLSNKVYDVNLFKKVPETQSCEGVGRYCNLK